MRASEFDGSAFVSSLDRSLRALDRGRTRVYGAFLGASVLRRVLPCKARRVPLLLAGHAVGAFLLAVFAAPLLLVLGPLIIGVPHLLNDVRYLALRRRFSRTGLCLLGLGSCSLLLVQAAHGLAWWPLGTADIWIGTLWVGALLALGVSARATTAGAIVNWVSVGLLSVGLSLWLSQHASVFRWGFVHAHNLVAILLWVFFFRAGHSRAVFVFLFALLAAHAFFFSPWLGTLLQLGLLEFAGLKLVATLSEYSLPEHSDALALSLTASFAFLQSVHYAIWLLAIPQEDTQFEGSPSFRKSIRVWLGDFGLWGTVACAALVLAVWLFAALNPGLTRIWYLRMAFFHGYFELAAGSLSSSADRAMMDILRLWCLAFALTLGLEQLLLLVLADRDKRKQADYAGGRWVWRWAAAVCFANICTHPAVWFILPELRQALHWSRATYLVLAELWAFSAEALLYWLVFPKLGLRRCLIRAALANLFSWQLGQWILQWSMDR